MEAKAAAVEAMPTKQVLELECGNQERFEAGKPMQKILDDATEQLRGYVQGLERQEPGKFDTSAFVVLTVGSRKLIWGRVNM